MTFVFCGQFLSSGSSRNYFCSELEDIGVNIDDVADVGAEQADVPAAKR